MNLKNLKIRREYLGWLREARGFSQDTIYSAARSIQIFDDFLGFKDYKSLNKNELILFKEKLKELESDDRIISLNTIRTHLLNLKGFLQWLSSQKGYKSNISYSLIQYLNPSNSDQIISRHSKSVKDYPDLQYVKDLCLSFEITNEVDLRDQALIAFTFLTGMRIDAIISLPLACLDQKNFRIYQDPAKGVRTKFSKFISSIVFELDDDLFQIIKKWLCHLKVKNFQSHHPVFPASKISLSDFSFEKPTEVTTDFWSSSASARTVFKERSKAAGLKYFHPHSFRHALCAHVSQYLTDFKQQKAFSQLLGHEKLITTTFEYGNLQSLDLLETIQKINFKKKPKTNDEIFEYLKEISSKS